jgi:hypothetical protein
VPEYGAAGGSRSRSRSRSRRRRSRSRSRRRRSRSRSFRLERSASRELYRELEPKVEKITKLVESQQEFILELLSEHKAEVDSKLQSRQRKFGNNQIEKQFEVKENFREQAEKILVKVKAGETKRAEKLVAALIKDIEQHGEDLVIADTSPFGWLAVAKVRSATDLPKPIRKRLEQVDKDLAAQRGFKNGGAGRKFSAVQGQGQEPVTRRGDRRLTPEEALFQAGRQIRRGTCSHCKKEYHYFKECPAFWTKVQESRAAKAKEDAAAN